MARYVSLSGGADSTALAILLHERGEDFKMVFADTGAELPETYYMVTKAARELGKELIVVSNGSLFQHLASWGFFLPSFRARWCTPTLKRKAYMKIFQEGDEVGVGILADEAKRAVQGDVYTKTYELVNAGMVKKDAKALCEKYGLLNPVYAWRTRVNCFCCFFQSPTEWLGLNNNHPSLFALAEQWEEASLGVKQGYTWIKGKQLSDIRIADANQIKLWPEPEGEPCLICKG